MSGITIGSNADAIQKMHFAIQSASSVSQVEELNVAVAGSTE